MRIECASQKVVPQTSQNSVLTGRRTYDTGTRDREVVGETVPSPLVPSPSVTNGRGTEDRTKSKNITDPCQFLQIKNQIFRLK